MLCEVPVFARPLIGSPINFADCLIGSPISLQSAAQVYALVGVAAMLAANCRVPLTSVLLLFELTHDYFIILVRLGLLKHGLGFRS